MRVSIYPLCLHELCYLLGILFINEKARGLISQNRGAGSAGDYAGDPPVAARNNSWKMKSGGISVHHCLIYYVGSYLAPPLLSSLQSNTLATVLTWFSHSQTCLRKRKTRGRLNGTQRCIRGLILISIFNSVKPHDSKPT